MAKRARDKSGTRRTTKELGSVTDYVSIQQLFDNKGQYKLGEKVETAYQKDPSARNQYEKELINVDERLNIMNSIFTGRILNIFPIAGHDTEKWTAINFSAETAARACKGQQAAEWKNGDRQIGRPQEFTKFLLFCRFACRRIRRLEFCKQRSVEPQKLPIPEWWRSVALENKSKIRSFLQ